MINNKHSSVNIPISINYDIDVIKKLYTGGYASRTLLTASMAKMEKLFEPTDEVIEYLIDNDFSTSTLVSFFIKNRNTHAFIKTLLYSYGTKFRIGPILGLIKFYSKQHSTLDDILYCRMLLSIILNLIDNNEYNITFANIYDILNFGQLHNYYNIEYIAYDMIFYIIYVIIINDDSGQALRSTPEDISQSILDVAIAEGAPDSLLYTLLEYVHDGSERLNTLNRDTITKPENYVSLFEEDI